MICTSTYIRSVFPGIIDRNKEGYATSHFLPAFVQLKLTILLGVALLGCKKPPLLFHCPTAFPHTLDYSPQIATKHSLHYKTQPHLSGIILTLSSVWKAARIGERLSPYVSICCFIMAVLSLYIHAVVSIALGMGWLIGVRSRHSSPEYPRWPFRLLSHFTLPMVTLGYGFNMYFRFLSLGII